MNVTAAAKTKVYGQADPALTYTACDLVAGDSFTGSLARAAGNDVGTYAITKGSLSAGSNYDINFTGANLTVTAKPITVTADAKTKVYGQADPALTYSTPAGALVGSDALTGSLGRTAGSNVGTYAITQGSVGGSNYDITFAGANLTVTAKPITVTADATSKVYGSVDPTLTYTTPAGALVGNDELNGSLSRTEGNNVGTYAITRGSLGGSNYDITYAGANLTITAKPITVTAADETRVYGDADPALSYSVPAGALETGDAFTGSLVRAAGSNVGTYAITKGSLTAGGNYTVTVLPATLTVTAKPVTVTADAKSKVYGAADPTLTYVAGALVGDDTFSGTLVRAAGKNVGTYAIGLGSLSAGTNYDLTFVGANLTIGVKTVNVTAAAKTKVYGQADPALTYTAGALESGDSFTGSLARAAGTDVGSYAIGVGTLSAGSNYDLNFTGANLTVTAKPITVTAAAKTKVYGSADPVLTYTAGALESGDRFSGSLSRAAGTAVGTYAINQGDLTAGSNYDISFIGADLTVTAKPITVTAADTTKVYGQDDPALTYTVPAGALEAGDSFSGSLSRAPGSDVGAYAITQSGLTAGTNYTLTVVPAALTITAKAITITAVDKTKVYGEQDPALTYTVPAGALVGNDAFTGSLSRASGSDVGTYAITRSGLTAGTNYTLTVVPAVLTITAKAITVTAQDKTKVYGEVDPALTYTVPTGALVGTDALTGALSRVDGSAVGTYAISKGSLTAGGNYTLTVEPAELTITAKAITVTAAGKTKVYGQADPALTYTASGLETGDSFTGSLARAAGNDVGTYAITKGDLSAGSNYTSTSPAPT